MIESNPTNYTVSFCVIGMTISRNNKATESNNYNYVISLVFKRNYT